jgi:hypothetical protein
MVICWLLKFLLKKSVCLSLLFNRRSKIHVGVITTMIVIVMIMMVIILQVELMPEMVLEILRIVWFHSSKVLLRWLRPL